MCVSTSPRAPSFLSPFEFMYGRPFLLGNSSTTTSPLGGYIPILNLVRQILRKHADHVLPKLFTGDLPPIPVIPGNWVLLKDLYSDDLNPRWQGPYQVLLTSQLQLRLPDTQPGFIFPG